MSARHTPGPWFYDFGADIVHAGAQPRTSATPSATPICGPVLSAFDQDAAHKAWKANRRLISAAPELLEACVALMEIADGAQPMDVAATKTRLAMVRDAVAKATGATP